MEQYFKTEIVTGDRGRVSVILPFNPQEVWGKSPRYYVAGTINGMPFHTSLGVRSGSYFFPFNKKMQEQTGLKPGDTAEVIIRPSTGEQQEEGLPEDFSSGLGQMPAAAAFFEGLSSFYKNTWLKWINSAKGAETRQKRIAEAVTMLQEGKKQR